MCFLDLWHLTPAKRALNSSFNKEELIQAFLMINRFLFLIAVQNYPCVIIWEMWLRILRLQARTIRICNMGCGQNILEANVTIVAGRRRKRRNNLFQGLKEFSDLLSLLNLFLLSLLQSLIYVQSSIKMAIRSYNGPRLWDWRD